MGADSGGLALFAGELGLLVNAEFTSFALLAASFPQTVDADRDRRRWLGHGLALWASRINSAMYALLRAFQSFTFYAL